jgi:hypothetical protein
MSVTPNLDETNIFNSEEKAAGSLIFEIQYIKGQIFMGEKFGTF